MFQGEPVEHDVGAEPRVGGDDRVSVFSANWQTAAVEVSGSKAEGATVGAVVDGHVDAEAGVFDDGHDSPALVEQVCVSFVVWVNGGGVAAFFVAFVFGTVAAVFGGGVGVFDFSVVAGTVFVKFLVVVVRGLEYFFHVSQGLGGGNVVASSLLVANHVDHHGDHGGGEDDSEGEHDDGEGGFAVNRHGSDSALVDSGTGESDAVEFPGGEEGLVGFPDEPVKDEADGERTAADEDAEDAEVLVEVLVVVEVLIVFGFADDVEPETVGGGATGVVVVGEHAAVSEAGAGKVFAGGTGFEFYGSGEVGGED